MGTRGGGNINSYIAFAKLLRHARRTASRAMWRRTLHNTAGADNGKTLWAIERWARLRSHLPYTLPTLPPLQATDGAPIANSHKDKATILSQKFFPHVTPTPHAFQRQPRSDPLPFDLTCTPGLIAATINNMGIWKAPSPDGLPVGFLKAVGKRFYQALARITKAIAYNLDTFPLHLKRLLLSFSLNLTKPRLRKEWWVRGDLFPFSIVWAK